MKHTSTITIILLAMFLATQFIGLVVVNLYAPTDTTLPYGTEPPSDISPKISLLSIIIAIFFAVLIMLLLMRLNAELFLRLWFFIVVIIALGISLNAFLLGFQNSAVIALIIALPLAAIKVFNRNIIVHNLTELLIYPGIAAIFVPLLSIWTVVLLLVLISIYDIYAVWHAGFMQKMAKYQIEKVKVFSGFFVPYMAKKEKAKLAKAKKNKRKDMKVKVNLAILGGGDVVFPIILAGTVLLTLGLIQALFVSIGATIALGLLFYLSEKGKFYPAMPFISAGCFVGLALGYLIL